MCDAQPGVDQRVGPQGVQADVGEAAQVLSRAGVQGRQQGALAPKKSTQGGQRAGVDLLRSWGTEWEWEPGPREQQEQWSRATWTWFGGTDVSQVEQSTGERGLQHRLSSPLVVVDPQT